MHECRYSRLLNCSLAGGWRWTVKSTVMLLLAVLASVAQAELVKDCDWNCRRQIDFIEAEHFPLHANNTETRQDSIVYVTTVAQKSNLLSVKLRALEALASNASAINPETRALTLKSIAAIASESNDEQLEYKAIQMIAHSLKSQNPEMKQLAAQMIATIASRSEQKMTQTVAMNHLERSGEVDQLVRMKAAVFASQAK